MPPLYAHDPFIAVHQALQSRWLDLPMTALSVACEAWLLAILGLALYSWLERDVPAVLKTFAPLTLVLGIASAAGHLLRLVSGTPRPVAVYGVQVHLLTEPLLRHASPSGHSLAVAAFASYTLLAYGRRGMPALVLAVLGGISGVYVGTQWVTDVVGGWAVGALLGAMVHFAVVRAFPSGHLARLVASRAADAPEQATGEQAPRGGDAGPGMP